ncbi:uncharacterized protein LOC141665764 [Apium graveolens]|uniref:uncharacterized protein LOC141665764 n=1 Tax=Apium graveolens TaxID=4045 RepID=UPI003D7B6E31
MGLFVQRDQGSLAALQRDYMMRQRLQSTLHSATFELDALMHDGRHSYAECKQKGHYSNEYPAGRTEVTYFQCGKKGHVARDCRGPAMAASVLKVLALPPPPQHNQPRARTLNMTMKEAVQSPSLITCTFQSIGSTSVLSEKVERRINPKVIKECSTKLFSKDTYGAENSNYEEEYKCENSQDLYGMVDDDDVLVFEAGYCSLGPPTGKCQKCGANMWKEERVNKNVKRGTPEFAIYFGRGQIKLPKEPPTPEYIIKLYNDPKMCNKFRKLIRLYNIMFAFTSMGGKVDHSINNGSVPYVYRLNGQNHHVFGSLIPNDGENPKFYQLYIYDTDHEVENRMRWVNVSDGETVDAKVVEGLLRMLDDTNELVKYFRMARDRFKEEIIQDLKIVMKVCRVDSGRENFIGLSNEVGAIMVGDLEDTCGERDIIIESKTDGLQHISDIHPKLMALQYLLLFPTGEDGYHDDIPYVQTKNNAGKKRKRVTMKEYYAYKLQVRPEEAIEQARLWWFRTHQTTLRNDLYDNIAKSFHSGEADTSNIGKGYSRQDSPDIVARVFKMKLDQIVEDVKKRQYFGVCVGIMYVVEFQKRSLPHVHMLIWLNNESKKKLNANMDKFVSAEIPDPIKDPIGYAALGNNCDTYCAQTIFDKSGFPVYKRRKTVITVRKGKADLDNQYVVPYNRDLLVKYQCHMNVEICYHARSLKYIFKYCLKGHDRATIEVSKKMNEDGIEHNLPVDEIKAYFDGRYICGAEAAHRMFGFDILHRSISVLRLSFHFLGKRSCTFRGNEDLQKVMQREKFKRSQFKTFFQLNIDDKNARAYTYDQIPKFYVWNDTDIVWTVHKRGIQIGTLLYTHHSSGEIWYLYLLLSKVRSPTSFKHLKTVHGVVCSTFKEACLKYGFLAEDNEWHQVLEDCAKCGFPPQIRELFVHIMMNCQVSDLGNLWSKHWKDMSDDIIRQQRKLSGNAQQVLSDQQLQFYVLLCVDDIY